MNNNKVALLFPGQGSQFVGMAKGLCEQFTVARTVFEEVDSALGYGLSSIIFDGPKDKLNLTINTQPAIMAASIAAFRVLDERYKAKFGAQNSITNTGTQSKVGNEGIISRFEIAAGHSLGEYSAHAACGTFSLSDTAKLLHARGSAMQRAVPVGKGGMVALIGCTIELAEEICKNASEHGLCQVANDNGAGQIVISGAVEAMQYIVENYKNFSVRKAIMLSVSAPFHSAWMQPAANEMERELNSVSISRPKVSILANVSAQPVNEAQEIISSLVLQVAGKVRWRESIDYMVALGINTFVEIGPSKVLTNIINRVDKNLKTYNLIEPESFDVFLEECFGNENAFNAI